MILQCVRLIYEPVQNEYKIFQKHLRNSQDVVANPIDILFGIPE